MGTLVRGGGMISKRSRRSVRAHLRPVVASLLVTGLFLMQPSSALATARGTYVLQQASRGRDLRQARSAIRKALAVGGVTGLSVRVPWSDLEPSKGNYNFRVLREAYRIAGSERLQIRFMAGRYTPRFWRGHSMVYDGSATGGLGKGSTIPLPFARDGGPNRRFERGWRNLVDHLMRWARRHRVHLVHMSWPGLLWSEIALIDQMKSQRGYSYREVRNTHYRLMNYALKQTTRRLDVEFPITGHAPSRLFSDITRHLLRNRRRSRCVLGTNNLSDSTSGMAAAGDAPPPRRGAELVGQSNMYDWSQVYSNASSIYAEYVEVYLPSFTGGTSAQLAQEASLFYGS
jgi:hypothetical protein